MAFVVDDAMKMIKNKYIFMEAIYRMIEMIRCRTKLTKI